MNWLRCVFALLLGAIGVFSAPQARALTVCSVTSTPLDFNSATAGGTTIATLSYQCSTLSFASHVAVGMCFAIGPGSPTPPSTIANRVMTNQAGDPLSFQIYKDPPRSQIWGDSPAQPSYLAIEIDYPVGLFGQSSGQINIHGSVADLSQAAAGNYRNVFNDARLIYSYRESTNPNAPRCDQGNGGATEYFPFEALVTVPPKCSVVTASDMNFSPGGMPLSGTSTGDLTSTSTIDLTCTKRTAWQVGLDEGQNPNGGIRQMCNPGGACIAYQLNQPDGATPWGDDIDVDTVDGISAGTPQTLTVNGRVSDQPLTQAGRYSDTVKVILTY